MDFTNVLGTVVPMSTSTGYLLLASLNLVAVTNLVNVSDVYTFSLNPSNLDTFFNVGLDPSTDVPVGSTVSGEVDITPAATAVPELPSSLTVEAVLVILAAVQGVKRLRRYEAHAV